MVNQGISSVSSNKAGNNTPIITSTNEQNFSNGDYGSKQNNGLIPPINEKIMEEYRT